LSETKEVPEAEIRKKTALPSLIIFFKSMAKNKSQL